MTEDASPCGSPLINSRTLGITSKTRVSRFSCSPSEAYAWTTPPMNTEIFLSVPSNCACRIASTKLKPRSSDWQVIGPRVMDSRSLHWVSVPRSLNPNTELDRRPSKIDAMRSHLKDSSLVASLMRDTNLKNTKMCSSVIVPRYNCRLIHCCRRTISSIFILFRKRPSPFPFRNCQSSRKFKLPGMPKATSSSAYKRTGSGCPERHNRR